MLIELLGWIAAAFTLAAYSMRTMLPLRIAAIGSNVFFVAYAALAEFYPVLVLHLTLLPFNILRLMEILNLTNRLKRARTEEFQIEWIANLVPARTFPKGSQLFKKGDRPDNLYYLVKGEVQMAEADVSVNSGEIFGEIAFFSDAKERTLTAECATECEIVIIDEAEFMKLYYQNPAFGMYVVRLISRRLIDGMHKAPGAFVPTPKAAHVEA